jgi:hypothetical protein
MMQIILSIDANIITGMEVNWFKLVQDKFAGAHDV